MGRYVTVEPHPRSYVAGYCGPRRMVGAALSNPSSERDGLGAAIVTLSPSAAAFSRDLRQVSAPYGTGSAVRQRIGRPAPTAVTPGRGL